MAHPGEFPTANMAEFADELAAAADGVAVELDAAGVDAAAKSTEQGAGDGPRNLDLVWRIPVTIKVVLGQATLPVSILSRLQKGDIVPLDRKVSDAADIIVNGRVVARGRVVVADESTGRLGISLIELVTDGAGSRGARER